MFQTYFSCNPRLCIKTCTYLARKLLFNWPSRGALPTFWPLPISDFGPMPSCFCFFATTERKWTYMGTVIATAICQSRPDLFYSSRNWNHKLMIIMITEAIHLARRCLIDFYRSRENASWTRGDRQPLTFNTKLCCCCVVLFLCSGLRTTEDIELFAFSKQTVATCCFGIDASRFGNAVRNQCQRHSFRKLALGLSINVIIN